MTLKEAADELWKMSDGSAVPMFMLPKVAHVLRVFEQANGTGHSYIKQLIGDVRRDFNDLSKGGRGKISFEKAQAHLRQSIYKLENQIAANGDSFDLRF